MEQAIEIAERLRLSVSNEQPVLAARSFPSGTLSISIGISSRFIAKGKDQLEVGEEMFRTADQALYRAKEMGRNAVSTGR
jgi:diguanylate cyclase (GGDEF)-like protein